VTGDSLGKQQFHEILDFIFQSKISDSKLNGQGVKRILNFLQKTLGGLFAQPK
jgi:hypothetical protein